METVGYLQIQTNIWFANIRRCSLKSQPGMRQSHEHQILHVNVYQDFTSPQQLHRACSYRRRTSTAPPTLSFGLEYSYTN